MAARGGAHLPRVGDGLSATPLHAFQGITLPLSVLAVEGVQRLGWRRLPYAGWVSAIAVFLFTVPATAYELNNARKLGGAHGGNANFIARDERSALDYLADDRTPGGVLTRSYLGAAVPGKTGRRTLVGDCLWSQPNCPGRINNAQALFDGTADAGGARIRPRHRRDVRARGLPDHGGLAEAARPGDPLGTPLRLRHRL